MVVGLGNPDRGDDGVGAVVVRALSGRLPDGVELIARSGDMLALIDDWDGVDAVICVDAAARVDTPGRTHRIDAIAEQRLLQDAGLTSSHAFGLAEVIGLARALGRAPAEIVVYAIEGDCFDVGAPVSAAVAAAAQAVATRIAGEFGNATHSAIGADSHA